MLKNKQSLVAAKKCYIVLLCNLFFVANAQVGNLSALDILKKATTEYSNKTSLNYNVTYNLYFNYFTNTIHQTYSGVIVRKNGVNYFKVKNTEFVIFKNHAIKINHDQKALVIADNTALAQESPLSLVHYLKGFNYKLVNSSGDFYNCELVPKGKMSQFTFVKIILTIKKRDFSLSKQTIFYAQNMESKDKNGKTIISLPRLEVSFSEKSQNSKGLVLKQENYFNIINGKVAVSPKWANYKIFKS